MSAVAQDETFSTPANTSQKRNFCASALARFATNPALRARDVDQGEIHERIILAVTTKESDLIVIGTHGRTGRAHSLAGSLAESLVRTAKCPVMTIREPG